LCASEQHGGQHAVIGLVLRSVAGNELLESSATSTPIGSEGRVIIEAQWEIEAALLTLLGRTEPATGVRRSAVSTRGTIGPPDGLENVSFAA
jgi:hypothetical protein